MNYKELRLGNLVNDKRQPPYSPVIYHPSIVEYEITFRTACVSNLKTGEKSKRYEDSLTPIELTEEWLLKLGFKPFGKDFIKKGIVIHKRKRGWVLRKTVPIIKSVHQLQNLFYCLTGEELELIDENR